MEMKGSYRSMEGPSAISEHLKIVEVKCNVVDKRILKVLRFLSALNMRKLTSLHTLCILKLPFICAKKNVRKQAADKKLVKNSFVGVPNCLVRRRKRNQYNSLCQHEGCVV